MKLGENAIAALLCELTSRLQETTGEGPHGILGGPDGYGCEYENDVFMMHPFCWCEEPECPWCVACFCPDEYEYLSPSGERITEAEFDKYDFDDYPDGRQFDGMRFVGVECRSCAEGRTPAPNFVYKPTGGEVRWYKYIGRGMEIEGEFPPDFLAKCLESLEGL